MRACAGHAQVHGPGRSYLIQHSAGSGKSKEIAWRAPDLSTLHGEDAKPVFDKVIVITDRQVLDRQLRAQVKAFEQVPGPGSPPSISGGARERPARRRPGRRRPRGPAPPGRPRGAAEPLLLRLHRDAEAAHQRGLRHARARRHQARVPHLLDAARPSRRSSSSTCSATTRPTRRRCASRTGRAASSSCPRARPAARSRASPASDTVARGHIAGEAKVMVVTASREEAVQWKRALEKEIAARSSRTRMLVAFSGEVTVTHPEADDRGESYTEPKMNALDGVSLPEKQLPAEFDKPAYGVLVVAEKYQTGFDQPKLVAMYVDKTLTGINTVQTLSRLNRTHPLKTETFVLDFVNEAEQIRKDFEPFFGRTEAFPTDPNVLFDGQEKLLDGGVIFPVEVDAFADAWCVAGTPDHAVLSGLTRRPRTTGRASSRRRSFWRSATISSASSASTRSSPRSCRI